MTKEEIRQEALKAEKEEFPRCAGDKENSFNGVNSAYGLGFVDGALWADNNPKSYWISVDDDLPYNNQNDIHFGFTNYVLAIDEDKNIFIAFMRKDKNDKWVWSSDDDYDLSYRIITHWMPIPKLPDNKNE